MCSPETHRPGPLAPADIVCGLLEVEDTCHSISVCKASILNHRERRIASLGRSKVSSKMTDVFMPYSSRFLHSSDRLDLPKPILPPIANSENAMSDSGSSVKEGDRTPLSPPSTRPGRKRAAPMDGEANNAKIRHMNIKLTVPSGAITQPGDARRDAICLCKQAPKIPRPRNGT